MKRITCDEFVFTKDDLEILAMERARTVLQNRTCNLGLEWDPGRNECFLRVTAEVEEEI